MANLINIIAAISSYTPTLLIGTLIGSAIVLLLKRWVKFPDRLIPWIWICFIFSFSFLSASLLSNSYKSYQVKQELVSMSPDEKAVLKKFIEKDVIKLYSQYKMDPIMIALEKKGIIYKAYEGETRGAVYIINHLYFNKLKKHPEWIE
jgi:hypothetical protein